MQHHFNVRKYMQEHLSLYIFVSVLFLMGVIFGTLLVNALSLEQKQSIGHFLSSFLHTVNQGTETAGFEYFQQTFSMHLKWILLIFVLGLSVIGLPLVLILDFLKGVLVGFTVGYMVGEMAWKGVLLALVSVAPQNLILIPVIMISSVTAISFSLFLIKNRLLQKRGLLAPVVMSYLTIFLMMIGLTLLISLFEAYITPEMIGWISPHIVSLADYLELF